MDERNRVLNDGEWSVQEARARFSEVVDAAMAGRPQRVTRRGRDAVVVVSAEEWARVGTPKPKPKMSFGEFLATFPLTAEDIDLTEWRRRPSPPPLFQDDRDDLADVAPTDDKPE